MKNLNYTISFDSNTFIFEGVDDKGNDIEVKYNIFTESIEGKLYTDNKTLELYFPKDDVEFFKRLAAKRLQTRAKLQKLIELENDLNWQLNNTIEGFKSELADMDVDLIYTLADIKEIDLGLSDSLLNDYGIPTLPQLKTA